MNALVFFFVPLAEVLVAVLSVLNLPRQGLPATCPVGHCCVCSPLLFASEILCDSPTFNKQRMKPLDAWKPKVRGDVMLNGVFRNFLWLVARQKRIQCTLSSKADWTIVTHFYTDYPTAPSLNCSVFKTQLQEFYI